MPEQKRKSFSVFDAPLAFSIPMSYGRMSRLRFVGLLYVVSVLSFHGETLVLPILQGRLWRIFLLCLIVNAFILVDDILGSKAMWVSIGAYALVLPPIWMIGKFLVRDKSQDVEF